jgi:hypothetical protein
VLMGVSFHSPPPTMRTAARSRREPPDLTPALVYEVVIGVGGPTTPSSSNTPQPHRRLPNILLRADVAEPHRPLPRLPEVHARRYAEAGLLEEILVAEAEVRRTPCSVRQLPVSVVKTSLAFRKPCRFHRFLREGIGVRRQPKLGGSFRRKTPITHLSRITASPLSPTSIFLSRSRPIFDIENEGFRAPS